MKIGDEVYIHGYVDEIRQDYTIIRNRGGFFGAVPSEIINTPVWRWHPYPEERPAESGEYLIETASGIHATISYHAGKGKWNVTDDCEEHEFQNVIAWTEIVSYTEQEND